MKNHGLARTMCWTVENYGANSSELYNGCPWLKVSIVSTNETKNSFPFDFKVTFTYILKNGALKILQEYTNTDINASRMPFYAGFHPYFAVNTKNINYTTAAAKCFDYNDAQEKPFYSPFDISCKPEAVLLNDKGNGEIDFYEFDALNKTVSIKYGSEFKYIMLWSAQGKPFMCVEPWMARTGELNTKEELTWLGAGESLTTWLEIYKK
jgi:galactose mutarotase-like enzyme